MYKCTGSFFELKSQMVYLLAGWVGYVCALLVIVRLYSNTPFLPNAICLVLPLLPVIIGLSSRSKYYTIAINNDTL